MSDSFATTWTVCSPLGSSVHGISQTRILERVAISLSRGSSQTRDQNQVVCFTGGFFTVEPLRKPILLIFSSFNFHSNLMREVLICILQVRSLRYSVQFSRSVMSDSLRPHELQHARSPCPSPTPESIQTHVHWVGNAIQTSHPLSSPSPPALSLSQDQGLFSESALCIRWPKYWSFSFSISPSNE